MNDKVEAMAPMFLKHGYALARSRRRTSGWRTAIVKKLSLSLKQIGKIPGIDAKKPILFGYSRRRASGFGTMKDPADLAAWSSMPLIPSWRCPGGRRRIGFST